jgi:hypothetical protein
MKKILFGFGIALATMGLYTSALGEGNSFTPDQPGQVETLQDTIPGKKRDTTNRRPMPQDTITRDSNLVVTSFVVLN